MPKASLRLKHHKNESQQGAVTIPVVQPLVEVLTLLEQASHHLDPASPTMWFNLSGEPYSTYYWSQICSGALSFGGQHITGEVVATVACYCCLPALPSH